MPGYSTYYAIPQSVYDTLTKLMTAKQLENIRSLKIGQINFNSGKSVRCTQTFKTKKDPNFFDSSHDSTGDSSHNSTRPANHDSTGDSLRGWVAGTPTPPGPSHSPGNSPQNVSQTPPHIRYMTPKYNQTLSTDPGDSSNNLSNINDLSSIYTPVSVTPPVFKSPRRGRGGARGRPRGSGGTRRTPTTPRNNNSINYSASTPNNNSSPGNNNNVSNNFSASTPNKSNKSSSSMSDLIDLSPPIRNLTFSPSSKNKSSIFQDSTFNNLRIALPNRRRKLSFSIQPSINISPKKKSPTPKKKSPSKKDNVVVKQVFDSTLKKTPSPKKKKPVLSNIGTSMTPPKTPEILTRNVVTSTSFITQTPPKKKKLLVPENETVLETAARLTQQEKNKKKNISNISNTSENNVSYLSSSPLKTKTPKSKEKEPQGDLIFSTSPSKSPKNQFKKIQPQNRRSLISKKRKNNSFTSSVSPKSKKKKRLVLGKELELLISPGRTPGLSGVKNIRTDIERSKNKVAANRLRDSNMFITVLK